jgi:hypothetical protein
VGQNLCDGSTEVDTSREGLVFVDPISINFDAGLRENS